LNTASPSTRNPSKKWRISYSFYHVQYEYMIHRIYGSFSVSHPTNSTRLFLGSCRVAKLSNFLRYSLSLTHRFSSLLG
jgi:hypothetical protein